MAGIGQLGILGASLSYAFAAIFARRFKELKSVVVAAGMLCCSTIIMIPIALIVDKPWNLTPGPVTLAALVGLGVVYTAFAYLIYFKVLAKAGPTNILLVTFLVPVSAITLGSFFLEERLDTNAYIGMVIIFVGMIAIDGRLLKMVRRKNN